jgi:abhydrolase domain-containing protein 6
MFIQVLHQFAAGRYRLAGFHRLQVNCSTASISYRVRLDSGSATPVLFIHGLGTSSSSWIRILPSLRCSRSLYCLDLPGFGLSRFTDPYAIPTIPRLDEALDSFIHAIFPSRFIVVGHSLGGWLALRLALHAPELIERLVVINPAGIRYPGYEEQAKLFAVHTRADVKRLLETMWLRYPFKFRFLLRPILDEMRKRKIPEFLATVTESDFINDQLSSLTVPTDIVWGIDDRLILAPALHILQNAIPSSRTSLINHCGHIPQLERPRELHEVLSFLLDRT